MEKQAKFRDASELFSKVVEYLSDKLKKRYNTIDEAKTAMQEAFQTWNSYEGQEFKRFFSQEFMANPEQFGIEILGLEGDSVVNEHGNDNINENDMMPNPAEQEGTSDPFMTNQDKQQQRNVNQNVNEKLFE